MNSFKISVKNIKKSWKDYSVYFMTLIIGVAIFYMFNSIGHQKFMNDLSSSGNEIIKLLGNIIEGVSVLVAFVLGLLMVYANHFLIRRRKKEFGVYMMLGMGKNQVSKIIMGETLIVGMISLVVGIVIGIFGSQFLSILVGKMFLANLSQYEFLFSGKVVAKTIINFAIIFLIVLIFNTVTISKYDLIDLLQANKKGENGRVRNTTLCVILFVISIVALGYAYAQVSIHADSLTKSGIIRCIFIGIVATFVFFWSLAGFLLEALKKNKKLYYSKLNLFVIRQFCASIHSSSISMALISLLLFFSITAFSVGFSVKNTMNQGLQAKTPVDVAISSSKGNVSNLYKENGVDLDTCLVEDYVEIPIYYTKYITMGNTFGTAIDGAKEQFPYAKWDTKETVITCSDYNRIAGLYGLESLEMQEDEYAIICDLVLVKKLRDMGISEGATLKLGSQELKSARTECIDGFILMSNMSINMGIIVLPDSVVAEKESKCKAAGSYLVGNYKEKDAKAKRTQDKELEKVVAPYTDMVVDSGEVTIPTVYFTTKNDVLDSSAGMSVLAVFLVLYIGLVFIISSAAILALKALSDSIDSTGKYQVLSKIGAERKMMDRSLFVQNLIHFTLPLVVGAIHSVFGLCFAKKMFEFYGLSDMLAAVMTTCVAMVIVYGGYMMATYFGCRRIVDVK